MNDQNNIKLYLNSVGEGYTITFLDKTRYGREFIKASQTTIYPGKNSAVKAVKQLEEFYSSKNINVIVTERNL